MMIFRTGRMIRVELMKLFAHPFFYVSVPIVLVATALAAWSAAGGGGAFRRPHALELFATGAKWGLKLAGYVLVIFGAMLFAGEYDRGTIKVLLTRPVTRTDVFLAKCIVGLLLGLLLVAMVLATAWGVGCAAGELGASWDAEQYVTQFSEAQLDGHLHKALRTALLAVLAACFVGLFVSNLVESSGYAVAIALIVFIAVDTATVFFQGWAPYWASMYPSYAFDTLKSYAQGSSVSWKQSLHENHLPVWVPLSTMAACSAAGYAIFRARNITV
jgi:ABC-2 type transport system permease protein